MKHSLKIGLSFGLTSGVITTLGLIVGLYSGTHSKIVILGGILIIAITDALSDALGIHMSEESEHRHSPKEIWQSTIFTFLSKFVFASIFIAPIVLLPLATAVVVSVILGLFLLAIFSLYLARNQKTNPWRVITEHLLIALVVIVATHYIGEWINSAFI
jgi:VIT1/CCC1 family predicted Fe2+/Mn2+ transporter